MTPLATTQHKGVHRFVTQPPDESASLRTEILHGRAINRQLKQELTNTRAQNIALNRERHGLRTALASALAGPIGSGWRGVICDDCGCLCKPREACVMCIWRAHQLDERKAA